MRKLALTVALGAAALTGCGGGASHGGCVQTALPKDASYAPGVWLVHDRPVGYTQYEDSDIYTTPECADNMPAYGE
jgi:hypothetical protein